MKHFGLGIAWLMMSVFLLIDVHAAGAQTLLTDAVRNADRESVRRLLLRDVDLDVPGPEGTTALQWSALLDDVETAALLVRAGADVSAASRYGVTALTLACTNGSAAMIELLLKAGANPNTLVPDPYSESSAGETALMTAALTGKADAVRVLLLHGADIDVTDSWRGQTALMWAAAEGHAETVQVLVGSGASVRARSKGGFTPLLFAVREGQLGVVRALLDAGADVNDSLLIPRRVDVDPDATTQITAEPEFEFGPSALILAVANAHYELATLLLDRGADPTADDQGWTALHQITWVRKPGAGGNRPGPEGSGNVDSMEMVRQLVAHGADIDARVFKRPRMGTTDLNTVGSTPFLLAARTADAPLMLVLAELGADTQLSNEENTTPLLVAAGVGTRFPGEDPGTDDDVLEAVTVAVRLGGDLNAVDDNGETVMHGLAYKLAPSAVLFVIDNGAKIEVWNQENKFGWTPLRIAQGIVQRDNNTRPPSPTMVAAISQAMDGNKVALAIPSR